MRKMILQMAAKAMEAAENGFPEPQDSVLWVGPVGERRFRVDIHLAEQA